MLQAQLEEYETENRILKERPIRSGNYKIHSGQKAKVTAIGIGDIDVAEILPIDNSTSEAASENRRFSQTRLLEAAILRPALTSARSEVAAWKTSSVRSLLAKLPPLTLHCTMNTTLARNVRGHDGDKISFGLPEEFSLNKGSTHVHPDCDREVLLMSMSEDRLVKASIAVVDLRTPGLQVSKRISSGSVNNSRRAIRELRKKEAAAQQRLGHAAAKFSLTARCGTGRAPLYARQ